MKNKIIFWILTIGLLILSSVHFHPVVDGEQAAFFGDTGDGFFNIWILEHNYQNLRQGEFNLFDGRIFQPAGKNTLLWSDNLFVPTAFYIPFRLFTNPLTASYYTGILLSFISYLSYLMIFSLIFRIINDFYRKIPEYGIFLIPFFAYVTNFSISKFEYFCHFQNLSFCFSVLLFGCILGYFFYRKKFFFRGMVFAEVALLYSTPYYAVLGMCFILCWFLVQVSIDWRELLLTIRENIFSILISAGLFGFLAYHYMKVDKVEYQGYVYRSSRAHFDEFYLPFQGIFNFIIRDLDVHKNPESPSYLGGGLVLGILILLIISIPHIWRYLKTNYKNYKLYTLFAVIIIYRVFFLNMRNNTFAAISGLIILLGSLVYIFCKLIDRENKRSLRNMFLILILCAICCYGIAFGPSKYFLDNSINPSVWGILTKIIPGASSMRAIGRMCVPGQGFLFAIVLAVIFVYMSFAKKKKIAVCLTIVLLTIQIAEPTLPVNKHLPIKIGTTYRYKSLITASDSERIFFDEHPGLYLIVPVTPWHLNSRGMIYFTEFMNINLMNGYSAKSTELWDSIMLAETNNHIISEDVLDIAEQNGCDYVLIQKSRIPKYSYSRHIKPLNMKVVFHNDRFAILTFE
jgi:hypothetical protein